MKDVPCSDANVLTDGSLIGGICSKELVTNVPNKFGLRNFYMQLMFASSLIVKTVWANSQNEVRTHNQKDPEKP